MKGGLENAVRIAVLSDYDKEFPTVLGYIADENRVRADHFSFFNYRDISNLGNRFFENIQSEKSREELGFPDLDYYGLRVEKVKIKEGETSGSALVSHETQKYDVREELDIFEVRRLSTDNPELGYIITRWEKKDE